MKYFCLILFIVALLSLEFWAYCLGKRRKKAYIKLCDSLCGKDCLFREENPLQTGAYGPGVKDCKNCPLARLK